MKAPAFGGCAFSLRDLALQQTRQSVSTADHLQARSPLPEFFRLQAQVSAQQPENALHLVGRTAPVVGRKRVERKCANAQLWRMLNRPADGPDSGPMSCDPGQTASGSPAAVAVHDHCYIQSFMNITLHCKVTSQKKAQAPKGAIPRTRPDAGPSLVTFAASRTTFSSVERYSTYRFRPEAVIWQIDRGRLRSYSFTVSTIFAFSSTRRWRLRLPSVRAQSCFKLPKVNPFGCATREVSTLSRARS